MPNTIMENRGMVDVVTVARNAELKLPATCDLIRRHIPVNRLILVVGKSRDATYRVAERLADTIIQEDIHAGIGYARNLGLNQVRTDLYASIDADVEIGNNWFIRCLEFLRDPSVAACQGYARSVGRYYSKWQEEETVKPGSHVSLGNTLLRTRAIREVGMPLDHHGEDYELRKRLVSKGYAWITDPKLIATHRVSDIEMLAHYFRYGLAEPLTIEQVRATLTYTIARTIPRIYRYGPSLALYIALIGFFRTSGSLLWRSSRLS